MPTRRVGGRGIRYELSGPSYIANVCLSRKYRYTEWATFSWPNLYFDVLTLADKAQVTLQMTVFPI